jgi:CHAD domain-containing protein
VNPSAKIQSPSPAPGAEALLFEPQVGAPLAAPGERPVSPLLPVEAPAKAAGLTAPLLKVLQLRRQAYEVQLKKCQLRCSEEAVHQLRVSIRRLISHVALLECAFPGADLKKARRILKGQMTHLSKLRDVHVQLTFLKAHRKAFPVLRLMDRQLGKRERKLIKKARLQIRAFGNKKPTISLQALELRLIAAGDAATRRRQAKAVLRETLHAFREVVRRRRAIQITEPSTVHRTRVAFKKFRYMVEALSPDFTGYNNRQVRRLALYQRKMGLVQDLEVLQRTVNAFASKKPAHKPRLEPFGKYLQGRRQRALRRFIATADDLYQFWPPLRTTAA